MSANQDNQRRIDRRRVLADLAREGVSIQDGLRMFEQLEFIWTRKLLEFAKAGVDRFGADALVCLIDQAQSDGKVNESRAADLVAMVRAFGAGAQVGDVFDCEGGAAGWLKRHGRRAGDE